MILLLDMNYRKDSLTHLEFVEPIASIIGSGKCEVLHYSEVDGKTADKYDKVILTGTPLKDNEYMNHLDKFKWIKSYNKPLLGICAGMQAIAAVYGCELVKNQEIGMTEIETTKENPLFSGKFRAYELHNWTVESTNEFETLAKSKKSTQVIKLKKKEIYGILFHPEIRNKEIIERFAALI